MQEHRLKNLTKKHPELTESPISLHIEKIIGMEMVDDDVGKELEDVEEEYEDRSKVDDQGLASHPLEVPGLVNCLPVGCSLPPCLAEVVKRGMGSKIGQKYFGEVNVVEEKVRDGHLSFPFEEDPPQEIDEKPEGGDRHSELPKVEPQGAEMRPQGELIVQPAQDFGEIEPTLPYLPKVASSLDFLNLPTDTFGEELPKGEKTLNCLCLN